MVLLVILLYTPFTFALSPEDARHFQRRVGFHIDREFHQSLLKMSKGQAIDYVLSRVKTVALNPKRKWMDDFEKIYYFLIKSKKNKLTKKNKDDIQIFTKKIIDSFEMIPRTLRKKIEKNIQEPKKLRRALNMLSNNVLSRDLQAWWLEEMIRTDSPLTERMTLFWHNHFSTSYRKVKIIPWMHNQNLILRRHALGNFKDLLKEISMDAAMLWYLDSNKNIRNAPNENFAREVMELFTLGEGHYSENDIKEAARAFTGWNFDRLTGEFIFRRKNHDSGEKVFLGKKGRFNGNQILEILLDNRQTATFITTKVWKEFVSPKINMTIIKNISEKFYKSGYEIKVLLREILKSDDFYKSKGSLIKSPTDLIVGTLRQFEIDPVTLIPYAIANSRMGQELFNPPNVKGWAGGDKWINTATLLTRKDILSRLFRVGQKKKIKKINMMNKPIKMMSGMSAVDIKKWMGEMNKEELISILHPIKNMNKIKNKKDILAWTKQLIIDPVFQLR
jgi:uncharacterized protein (DUF1800 family)